MRREIFDEVRGIERAAVFPVLLPGQFKSLPQDETMYRKGDTSCGGSQRGALGCGRSYR